MTRIAIGSAARDASSDFMAETEEKGYCVPCDDYYSGPKDLFFIKHRGICARHYSEERERRDLGDIDKKLDDKRVTFIPSILDKRPVFTEEREIGFCVGCGGKTKPENQYCSSCRSKRAREWMDKRGLLEVKNEDPQP